MSFPTNPSEKQRHGSYYYTNGRWDDLNKEKVMLTASHTEAAPILIDSSNGVIKFTSDIDTHGTMSNGEWTCPISGFYNVHVSLTTSVLTPSILRHHTSNFTVDGKSRLHFNSGLNSTGLPAGQYIHGHAILSGIVEIQKGQKVFVSQAPGCYLYGGYTWQMELIK